MDNLVTKFEKMGARVKVGESRGARFPGGPAVPAIPLRVNILKDKQGEYFDVTIIDPDAEVSVIDVQPKDRHLLLLVRQPEETKGGGVKYNKAKFLCGHDERHWFVAAIPESAPVGTVNQAKDALKPDPVQVAARRAGLDVGKRNTRRNEVFVRQGEWFFIPAPTVKVDEKLVLRNEPIRRGRGKPHIVEFCYRTNGTAVWVNDQHANGVTFEVYQRIIKQDPTQRFRQMVRDAEVYVRGTVRHSDHKTITLDGWHRVLMNTESGAAAMRGVAFLD